MRIWICHFFILAGLSLFLLTDEFLNYKNLVEWFNGLVYDGSIAEIYSDSPGLVLHLVLLLLFSGFTAFVLRNLNLYQAYYIALVAILSLFLIRYGLNKVFLLQFPQPESNLLFSPLGNFSKDILYWTSMGTSPSYQIFMGLVEFIPGILILIPRTRLLGLMIAFAVFVNVFFVNLGFEIDVKILTIFLLLLTSILLFPYRFLLKQLFISGKESKIQIEFPDPSQNKSGIMLFLPLVYGLYSAFSFLNSESPLPNTAYRIIDVEKTEPNSLGLCKGDILHFHSEGLLLIQDSVNNFGHHELLKLSENEFRIMKNQFQLLIKGNNEMLFISPLQDSTLLRVSQFNLKKLQLNKNQ